VFKDVTFYGTDTIVDYPSGTKLLIEMRGEQGCSGFAVDTICSAPVNDRKTDIVPATIDRAHDKNAGEKTIGDVITIEPFKAYDVFSPYVETRVTVTLRKDGASSKEKVVSVDGVTLSNCDATRSYQVKLSEYGTYSVEVSVLDSVNTSNETGWNYAILVVDYTKPTVTVNSIKTEYKLNDTLTFPTFVTDIPEFKWYVTIKTPDSRMSYSDEETVANEKIGPYKFTMTGKYELCLVVYDSNMNTSETYFTIYVK
jgi:hypothetical protein